MDVIQREKAYSILKHYGVKNQRRQLVEECAELIQAICKYERIVKDRDIIPSEDIINFKNAKYDMAEEIADVLIMIEQIKMTMGADGRRDIEELIEFKLDRQLERIKKEESKREEII